MNITKHIIYSFTTTEIKYDDGEIIIQYTFVPDRTTPNIGKQWVFKVELNSCPNSTDLIALLLKKKGEFVDLILPMLQKELTVK